MGLGMRRPDWHPTSRSCQWRRGGALLLPLLLAACGLFGEAGPTRIAAIGVLHRDPDRAPPPLSLPDRLLLDATAQGLVSFSADGQIEAGLAERWTVIDDGKSYIFRLRQARWSDGQPVMASVVAPMLMRRIASPRLRASMRSEFDDVRDVRAMTSKVIEIRLARPNPDLLNLLAQPDLALARNGNGWGPWHVTWAGRTAVLSPIAPLDVADDDIGDPVSTDPAVVLWGSNTRNAVAKFSAGEADGVLGGRFEGWPLVSAANVANTSIVIDPVDGLFGLAVVANTGFLADGLSRDAVNMAIDRGRLIGALRVGGWRARTTIRPTDDGRSGTIEPIYPPWISFSPEERQSRARAIVSAWRGRNGGRAPVVRIALPAGPGARILFAWLRADLGAAGIDTQLVPLSADADLRLIDEVAPSDDPGWYLRRLACANGIACDETADRLIDAIRHASDPQARAAAVLAADEAVTRNAGFLPLAAPLRWSLVSNRISAVRGNPRGRHGLIRLVPDPT